MKEKRYTLAQAAKRIRCHVSTATRHAAKMGISRRSARRVLLTEAEVKKIANKIHPRPRR